MFLLLLHTINRFSAFGFGFCFILVSSLMVAHHLFRDSEKWVVIITKKNILMASNVAMLLFRYEQKLWCIWISKTAHKTDQEISSADFYFVSVFMEQFFFKIYSFLITAIYSTRKIDKRPSTYNVVGVFGYCVDGNIDDAKWTWNWVAAHRTTTHTQTHI